MKKVGVPLKTGFRPIHALMSENEAIAPMLQQLNLISRYQKTYIGTVPAGLCESSRVAAVEGSTLVIAVSSGAVAASLRQMLPRILAKFQENKKQEQEVTAIRVVVQPESLALDRPVVPTRRPSLATAPITDNSLVKLADALADSPLKATIEKIQKHRKRALTVRKKSV